jgi:hypothetical protein
VASWDDLHFDFTLPPAVKPPAIRGLVITIAAASADCGIAAKLIAYSIHIIPFFVGWKYRLDAPLPLPGFARLAGFSHSNRSG